MTAKGILQRYFSGLQSTDIFDGKMQAAEQFDAQQDIDIFLRVIPIAVIKARGIDKPLFFVETDIRPVHAGAFFNFFDRHMQTPFQPQYRV